MNPCMPDRSFEADPHVSNQTKPMGPENEVLELLWRNGKVVLQSQTHRRPSLNPTERRPVQKQTTRGSSSSYGSSSNLIQDDETVSWIQYPLEDSLEKEFYSDFFSDLPTSGPMEVDKHKRKLEEEKSVKFDASSVVTSLQQYNVNQSVVPGLQISAMPPPRFEFHDSTQQNESSSDLGKVVNFSQSMSVSKGEVGSSKGQFDEKVSGNLTQGEVKECSMMTFGSSHCSSNQIAYDIDKSPAPSNGVGTTSLSLGKLKDDVRKVISQSERAKTETIEPTVTSSSDRSGSSFNRTSNQSTGGNNSLKRKSRDAGESECQSEPVEFESAPGNKTAQRSGSCRSSRVAEMHNLSERRRRDRINEKMRALQELIPHCNKTDKASMLDEAIEYLKSLQLQLQVMWMGSGMAPMTFPGVQNYVSRMGMGMGPPALPSIANPLHMPRVPLVDQSLAMAQAQNQAMICQTPLLIPVNYQNQMQNSNFPDQYARYMSFPPMQTNSQPINMFTFGSPTMQSQLVSQPITSRGPFPGVAASDNAPLSGKTG